MNMGLTKKKMMNNENVIDVIECVRVDEKRHLCIPWENKTLCDIPIKHKNVTDSEVIKLYCCPECMWERW